MKVLIAIDSSAGSERVVKEAVTRPWPTGSEFQVLNAVDVGRFAELPALIEDAGKQGEKIVKEGAARLVQAGWNAEGVTVLGNPRRVICAYAENWGADLILTGSRGHGAVGRFLLGSVAQGVLRKAHCSVEIVRGSPETAVASSRGMKVLVCSDGSQCSVAAAQSVANRPWPKGSEFQVLSVEELVALANPMAVSSLASVYPASLLEELIEAARARATAALQETKTILKQSGLTVLEPSSIPAGDARTTILDKAEEWGSDLIVLGSHGRSGLDRILMGSVSETVAVHARCSVEVIRRQAAKGD